MASGDEPVVDDAVVPANAGAPDTIPAVIIEICHNLRVQHYEYVNHARPDLQCELWLVVLLGKTKRHRSAIETHMRKVNTLTRLIHSYADKDVSHTALISMCFSCL